MNNTHAQLTSLKNFPIGSVEPHAGLLSVPSPNTSLYKAMKLEHFFSSWAGKYLHFQRIDSYSGEETDPNDGKQPPRMQQLSAGLFIGEGSVFSVDNYFTVARSRTYACCFSLANGSFIQTRLSKGDICLVLHLDKLRRELNEIHRNTHLLLNNDMNYHQILSINYGVVSYVDYLAYEEFLSNPIQVAYIKHSEWEEEKEYRITLSAFGMAHFTCNNGHPIVFPESLNFPFDYKTAIEKGIIERIICHSNINTNLLQAEMDKVEIKNELGYQEGYVTLSFQ